jgi:hypothetical protein
MSKVLRFLLAVGTSVATAQPINSNCLPNTTVNTKEVTHYMIPLLQSYNKEICDVIEGTCIYDKGKVPYIHNFGYTDVPLAQSHCQNGWGNEHNCLHPCRVLAASMKYHQYGQIVFIKDLVGKKCGNLQRDGFELVHDGYMVVLDTGAPSDFHAQGRFDFFWGRCAKQRGGVCYEGAEPISDATSNTPYCTVWDPRSPNVNAAFKDAFVKQVQSEDRERGDLGAADDFKL